MNECLQVQVIDRDGVAQEVHWLGTLDNALGYASAAVAETRGSRAEIRLGRQQVAGPGRLEFVPFGDGFIINVFGLAEQVAS